MVVRVGILGSGQLAQLLAHAAYELGLETLCLGEQLSEPASRNSPIFLDDGSENCLREFAQAVDVITLENENIALSRLEFLQQFKPVYPGIKAVSVSQDRCFEKQTFTELGIPTVPFAVITNQAELYSAWQQFDHNALLKTRRFGYDGKGQKRIRNELELHDAWQSLGAQALILEGFMPFDYEVSLIGARNKEGFSVFYPLIHNVHQEGVLRTSTAPVQNEYLQQQAEGYMQSLFEHLDYVGVLAFEFFVKDQQLYANEIAPRVHNSGHLTLEGAEVSQFHLHLLSILNLPLISPKFYQATAMVNLIGALPDHRQVLEQCSGIHYYDYGKEARPGRKLGHLTFGASNAKHLQQKLEQIYQILGGSDPN